MKLVAGILAAFCLAYVQDVSAEIKILQKSHVDLTRRLMFNHNSYVDGHLTYALCDKKNPRADEIKCTVIREKKPYGDESYSCDVTLKRAANDTFGYPDFIVIPIGKNNVALVSSDTRDEDLQSYLTFTTVQMESCKVGEAVVNTEYPVGFYFLYVVGRGDSYDAFYGNYAISCDGKMCKVTIDADGKLVNGPSPSTGMIARYDGLIKPIVPLDDKTSKQKYFYFKEDGNDFVYTLVKNDGTEKSLAKHARPNTDRDPLISLATNNELIGVCYPIGEEYKCNQYDFDGNSKLETTLTKHANYNIIGIYNLPNGGFYTASSALDKNDFIQHWIERIDSNGKKTGSFKFQGLGKHKRDYYILLPFFYQNENKETCVSSIAYDSGDVRGPEEGKGHLYLTSNCFTDADFSK